MESLENPIIMKPVFLFCFHFFNTKVSKTYFGHGTLPIVAHLVHVEKNLKKVVR